MRFKDVFSIIGPPMIGPSSSHTAGAARLGRAARMLLAEPPVHAVIDLYGSFAETYRGHGTDLALVGGLLGFSTEDPRIPDSLKLADEYGLTVDFRPTAGPARHPNSVKIKVSGASRTVTMQGASIGGGNIEVYAVDDFDVRFLGDLPALLVFHSDRAGTIADIARVLSDARVNIARMHVDRKSRSGEALTVLETDEAPDAAVIRAIEHLPGVRETVLVHLNGGDGSCDSEP